MVVNAYNKLITLMTPGIRRNISIIVNKFGIDTDIYFPYKNLSAFGQEGIDCKYPEIPSVSGKFIIHGLTPMVNASLQALDPFYESGEVWLYSIDMSSIYPNNSLVKAKWDSTDSITFVIDKMIQSVGGSKAVFRKYVLTAVS